MSENKKITIDVTQAQHGRLKSVSKAMNVTQQELLSVIIDLTLSNLESIRPHVLKYVQKRDQEAERQREIKAKAERLISSLSPEELERLLAGRL